MRLPSPFLLLVACAYLPVSQAQTDVSEQDYFNDMPVVLSVSRLSQRLDETPGAVTVLDRDFIRQTGARDVADLLRFVPGFQVSNSFETVAPLVSYHGTYDSYSNRLELLIDGRSAYSPYFIGSIGPGLQTVAVQDIERIEVLQGSNSAAYGARAILGVINIVTRDLADTLGSQGSISLGDNGIRDVQAGLGWGEAGQAFRLTADTRGDDGLSGANGQNNVSRVNFRSDYRPNGRDEFQFRMGGLNIDSGKGTLGQVGNPWHDFSFDSNYVQVDWRRNLGVDADLAVKLSHGQEAYKDEFPYALRNLSPFYSPSAIYTVRANGQASSDVISAQYTWRQSPSIRGVLGGEFRSERIESMGLYNTATTFKTDFGRLFGNLEWRADPNWLVNAGAMAEKHSISGDTLAPRLMINWHATPAQTWRVGVSKAFRPPSNYENFSNVHYIWKDANPLLNLDLTFVKGPGNLLPEQVLSREIGYVGNFADLRLNLNVRVFREEITDFIRQVNGTGVRTYSNNENFAIKGVEYQLKWQPWQGAQLVFNQTYTDITSSYNGTATAVPQLGSSMAYFQKLPGNLNLSLMHTDNHPASLVADEPRAIRRTDLRLSKALQWGSHRGEISLVVQNLGSPYPDYKRDHLFEKQAFVTLRLEN
ncbi:MAG: TonB-dependent receptor [Rhodoferax sp.]|nr:TonB-dependent receptor [Rhodoferax sp.]